MMSTPVRIQLRHWFYPTGNTPAVNLLRDLPTASDKEATVNVLCLACGDPRNILFSLWSEQGYTSKRTVAFTCCDIEPAVLARNVVLLTLIADNLESVDDLGNQTNAIWNLFYHFFVPKSSLTILRIQVTKLLNASGSLQEWAASPYGEFIGYLNEGTLRQLRKYWTHYNEREGKLTSRMRDDQARRAIAKRSKEIENYAMGTGVRTAGPLWHQALETMALVYRKYWETGVAGGNPEDFKLLGNGGKGFVNPMFAVSGAPAGNFAVHYGTEPLLGFHLVKAFEQTANEHSSATGRSRRAVEEAKSEFKGWCYAFNKYVQNGRVRVNLFHGDALTLSHQLQMELVSEAEKKAASVYIKQWSCYPLHLDGLGNSICRSFDVIDTSNLGDHVGLINIISAVAHLLEFKSSSTIYTESLLIASENISSSLSTVLCSDVTTFALLVGVAPTGLLAGATMDAVSNEATRVAIDEGASRQHRMRISWKHPSFGDSAVVTFLKSGKRSRIQTTFDPKQLAAYLFDMYKAMFAHENMMNLMSRMQRLRLSQYSTDIQRYTRAGMVALLRLARARIQVDWERTINLFLDHVETDQSLLVGRNSLQELYMHLHLSALWTNPPLIDSPHKLQMGGSLGLRARSEEKGLLAEASAPSVVNVILVIPREKLRVFTDEGPEKIGTPGLHVSVNGTQRGRPFENCFFSFHCFFGRVLVSDLNAAVVEEDERGWQGKEDLVVSCLVPTFILLLGPRDSIRVGLGVSSSIESAVYSSSLGLRMVIFETGLKDEQRLLICRNPPFLDALHPQSAHKRWLESNVSQGPFQALVKLNTEHRATHLQNHIDFPRSSTESNALSKQVVVTATAASPCTVTLNLGQSLKQPLIYPFPVQGSQLKVRVARKSSWVEVEAPISSALDKDNFDSWTQMIFETGHPPVCWNIPRVNLAIQPLLQLSKRSAMSWLATFMGSTVSDAETGKAPSGTNPEVPSNAKFELKKSLNAIITSFVGLNDKFKGDVTTFNLTLARNMSCHTIIFATNIRHDLDLGSVVLDAYVVPLTKRRVQDLRAALGRLHETEPCGIPLSDQESRLWKRMLPALAERCRTWSHKSDCEYLSKGAPLSIDENQTPLCSCGMGKVSGTELGKIVEQWAPFAKFATRIAIAPIFPVPYVESSMSELRKITRAAEESPRSKASVPESQSSTPVAALAQCDTCGKANGPLKVCGRCGKARYCGSVCQKAAWKEHKKTCGRDIVAGIVGM